MLHYALFYQTIKALTMPEPMSYSQAITYNRHIVLPQVDLDGQEKIQAARILIIGLGGLGCPAAHLLCSSGVGHITLVDDDTVESSNLPRQTLYCESQIGQLKVNAAKDRLRALNADCGIQVKPQRLCDQALAQLIAQHDIVLDCTDNLSSRNQINALAYSAKRTLISGAAIRFSGQLYVVRPQQQTPCYQCLSRFIEDQELSCTESGVFAPVVATVGTLQAHLALLSILDIYPLAPGELMTYDGLTMQWQRFTVPANQHCNICQSSQKKPE